MGWIRAAAAAAGLRLGTVRKDDRPGQGPLGGIGTALRRAGRRHHVDACLFLSCDMPLVRADLLRKLIRDWRKTGRPVVCEDDHGFGFPWLLRVSDLGVVERQLALGQGSIQKLVRLMRSRVVRLPLRSVWQRRNVNTPRDRQELEAWVAAEGIEPEGAMRVRGR